MGQKGPAIKTNTDTDDGIYERGLNGAADQFGHTSRAEKVKDRPAELAMKTASNIVGAFAHDPKEEPAPRNEGEHPGIAAAKETLRKVTAGDMGKPGTEKVF